MAVDLMQFPTHVQEAIHAIDLPGNALARAQTGAVWLDKNAPLDWRLQMISIHKGRIHSQVRLCRNDENPLALAFRRVRLFQGSDGRVTWATLKRSGLFSDQEARKCGFREESHYAPKHIYIDENIDGIFLDEAWAAVLGEYRVQAQPVQAYPQSVETAYMLRCAARRLITA